MAAVRPGFTHEAPVRGDTDEWYTPPAIFDALGLAFDLDPASPGHDVVPWVPAAQHYTADDNGLWLPWHGRVWLNPPYGTQTEAWLDRLVHHGDGIALVFARTDTGWFHAAAPHADVLLFVRGRIRFVRPDGNPSAYGAGTGSLLMAFGAASADALRHSGLGVVMESVR